MNPAAMRGLVDLFLEKGDRPGGSIEVGPGFGQPRVPSSSRELLEAFANWLRTTRAIGDQSQTALEEREEHGGAGRRPLKSYDLHLVQSRVWISDRDVAEATVSTSEWNSEPIVSLVFTTEAGERFAEVTEANVDRKLAIMLDGQVMSAPVIKERIAGGRAQITLGRMEGYGTMWAEATRLATVLSAGSYPTPVTLVNEDAWATGGRRATLLDYLLCYLPAIPNPFFGIGAGAGW